MTGKKAKFLRGLIFGFLNYFFNIYTNIYVDKLDYKLFLKEINML